MMGGGEIIASFLDEGEIDEFCVNVIPVSFPDGVVQLRYLVNRTSVAG
jgi:dihydrofolate reductase